jgi:carbonic anhydrase
LVASVSAAGGDYDYHKLGADWPDNFKECAGAFQSPIDLSTDPKNSKFTWVPIAEDGFGKKYTNQATDIQIVWKGGHTTQVAINKSGQDFQQYVSKIARKVYKEGKSPFSKDEPYQGLGDVFNGAQFHFHSESEHTIDGQRFDFEMHAVHLIDPKMASESEFFASAMGVIFDREKYTVKLTDSQRKIIDNFFDSMQWDQTNDPLVPLVNFGDLYNMLDMSNRWVYKGSLTTPPCSANGHVYFNVIKNVYPISEKHYEQFRKQLERGAHELGKTGNYRVIQEIKGQNPIMLYSGELVEEEAN